MPAPPTKRARQSMSQAPMSSGDSARRGLISLNKLDYVMDPDLSVATARAYKQHNFQANEYTSDQRGVCILNSGSDYIDPTTSYLRIDLETTMPAATAKTEGISFGPNSSATNLIRQFVLSARSGEEIERVEENHRLNNALDLYSKSPDWFAQHGPIMGYGPKRCNPSEARKQFVDLNYAAPLYDSDTNSIRGRAVVGENDVQTTRYCIPLSCISALFRNFDRLLPSHLMSGARIELQWNTTADAFVKSPGSNVATVGTSPLVSWKVKNVAVMLDSYTLTDSVMRGLNETAATSGLELPFVSYYHNATRLNSVGGGVNIEMRKAVSRALGVVTTINPTKSSTAGYGANTTSRCTGTNYQVRVGSLYFPQQPVKGDNDPALGRPTFPPEMYLHSLRAMGKYNTPSNPGSANLRDFEGDYFAGWGDNISGVPTANQEHLWAAQTVYATDFERSTTQKLSGIPVNASRVVEVRLDTPAPTDLHVADVSFTTGDKAFADQAIANTWLIYQRLLRVWINSVDVAE